VWVLFFSGGSDGAAPEPPKGTERVRLGVLEVDARARTRPLRGCIVVKQPVTAPLSGTPCAAFRIIGRVGAAAVDDTDFGQLAVVIDDEEVTIEAQAGAVELPMPSIAPTSLNERLRAFLTPRIGLIDGDVALAEAVLDDGDEVALYGAVAERDRPDGYRGSARERVILDAQDNPLLIRRRR
jgi:hypothetical protein